MITHLVLNGVADSSLGVGLDMVGSASRLAAASPNAARHAADLLRQQVVSVDGQPVQSGAGRAVAVDGAFAPTQLGAADVVVIPGWFSVDETRVEALLSCAETQQAAHMLRQAAAQGCLIAASCSATFLLAESGLLDGQRATTTWWLAAEFNRRFNHVHLESERMVSEAKGVITAGSAFAHADLMLAVLARLTSPSLAQWVTRYLVLDQRPSQSRYMVLEHLRLNDPALRKAEAFIRDHLARQISLSELAAVATMSPRTLARRIHAALGMTPNEWMQRLRVNHASHLLQTSQLPIEEIAAQVGYADPAAFRRTFKRFVGRAPSSLRQA